jgi:hypothetical protein
MSGFDVSFYWIIFPTAYLRAVRTTNLSDLKDVGNITLRHSKPLSLINPNDRDRFIGEFIAIIRCIADGHGNVGYLRRDPSSAIHRKGEGEENWVALN